MKNHKHGIRLFASPLIMLLLAVVFLIERQGIQIFAKGATLSLLEAEEVHTSVLPEEEPPSILVLYDSSHPENASYMQTLDDTLHEMRLSRDLWDITGGLLPPLSSYNTVLFCADALEPIGDSLQDLIRWIRDGGHFGTLMALPYDEGFRLLYRTLGIQEYRDEYHLFSSLRFVTNILPMMQGVVYGEEGNLRNHCMPVHLEADCVVHIETAGDFSIPLLWEHEYGMGRTVALNTSFIDDKDARGLALVVLTAVSDTLVYPIINAGVVFIDDFPAPLPEGYDERLFGESGYSTRSFFRNRWWPDMKRLVVERGVVLTGVAIETYNDQVDPPFEPEEDAALLRFYASELLHAGGEIGLHGYNHMPLCPTGFPYPAYIDYEYWPSRDNMQAAILELSRYTSALFPEAVVQTYVPPSNYLSTEGQAILRAVLPEVRVISGLYLAELDNPAYIQEFREEEDGSISMPRVSVGFDPNDYFRFVTAQELALHGVFSHFIHPDDVLDPLRGAEAGWESMYAEFCDYLDAIHSAYPALRYTSASSGAAAVQRYARLNVSRVETEEGLRISIVPFYDSAWLALRTRYTPAAITGGSLHYVDDGFYWIEANGPELLIQWENPL